VCRLSGCSHPRVPGQEWLSAVTNMQPPPGARTICRSKPLSAAGPAAAYSRDDGSPAGCNGFAVMLRSDRIASAAKRRRRWSASLLLASTPPGTVSDGAGNRYHSVVSSAAACLRCADIPDGSALVAAGINLAT